MEGVRGSTVPVGFPTAVFLRRGGVCSFQVVVGFAEVAGEVVGGEGGAVGEGGVVAVGGFVGASHCWGEGC